MPGKLTGEKEHILITIISKNPVGCDSLGVTDLVWSGFYCT